MIAIIDYGIGNIHSLQSAFRSYQMNGKGISVILTSDPAVLKEAELIILPGVGAFKYAMEELEKRNLISIIQELHKDKKPIVGICLGMQLLYESSEEYGFCKGLGLLKGKVVPFTGTKKSTHMGWNELELLKLSSPLVAKLEMDPYVYFVHSFYARDIDPSTLIATTNYGVEIPAIVQEGNLIGYQFHPEKSSLVGGILIQNLLEMLEVKK